MVRMEAGLLVSKLLQWFRYERTARMDQTGSVGGVDVIHLDEPSRGEISQELAKKQLKK